MKSFTLPILAILALFVFSSAQAASDKAPNMLESAQQTQVILATLNNDLTTKKIHRQIPLTERRLGSDLSQMTVRAIHYHFLGSQGTQIYVVDVESKTSANCMGFMYEAFIQKVPGTTGRLLARLSPEQTGDFACGQNN